ncbi:MAG: Zn-ribbon domain-containing OB-fold protein [Dehalococcoidia bacterium]
MTAEPQARPKPLPHPDFDTEPFWEALRQRELKLQRCQDCGEAYFYPRILCPSCWSENVQWERMSGKGEVYTYTVIYRAPHPAFAEDVPYIVAVVELEEGPRLPVNIVNCEPDAMKVGLQVEVVFEAVNEEITLARFKPLGA